MKFRKIDYIAFYIVIILVYFINVIGPINISTVLAVIIFPVFQALLYGTITNLVFRKW
jgi:hypothetical protein